jgi:hypothetical protein
VPLLDQLSQCLKSSLAAPPPKVLSVKSNRPTNGHSQDYTPDVPNAPADKQQHPLSTNPPTNQQQALAEHFNHQQVQNKIAQQQQTTKLPMAQAYIPNYPEPNGSIFAASPSVAVSGHHKK